MQTLQLHLTQNVAGALYKNNILYYLQ